jgi:hypothetical protein
MGAAIGQSESAKVMFMDPRTIPGTLEGIRSIVSDTQGDNSMLEQVKNHQQRG